MAFCLALAVSAVHADEPALWNRLNEALFVRTAPDDGTKYGRTQVDILFWTSTKHLLTSPSHEKAIKALDAFIREHGERQVRDPVKRALLQRDLWELFDWTAASGMAYEEDLHAKARAELQSRLITIIKRLALSADEIARLPDNYTNLEGSGFPRELFDPAGPWILVSGQPNGGPTAIEHTHSFGGRSTFFVFVRLPEGREQGLGYLEKLRAFSPGLGYVPDDFSQDHRPILMTNPEAPQFPVGTQWALVRRMNLIDDKGSLRPTHVIESIDTLAFTAIPAPESAHESGDGQAPAAFRLDREHAPALRVVSGDERDFHFVQFRSHGADPFELMKPADWARDRNDLRPQTLRTCRMCHAHPGILSVQTYTSFGRAANPLEATDLDRETSRTVGWKSRQFDWGLLQGLWRSR